MKNFPSNYEGIRNRLEQIFFQEVPEKGRFGWLEERTGIPRNTWQTFWNRKNSTPSGEMIQAVARLFPRYAFWLASGLTDQEFGHTFPKKAPMSKCFPEHQYHEDRKRFDDYFQQCMSIQMKQYDGGTRGYETDVEYRDAVETMEYLSWLREIELDTLREGKIEEVKKLLKERHDKLQNQKNDN